jgi:hypothetical protein
MVQRGRRPSLPAEAFQRLRVLGEVLRKEFQRDETAKVGVLGFVHHAHAATAKLLDDAVMRNCLANERVTLTHGAAILECRYSQVNGSHPLS